MTLPDSKDATRNIGKCIYCGSTSSLSNEHVIPYSLAGPWQLLKASCSECNKITSAFERDMSREYFILARTTLNMPTRRPKNRPTTFKFAVEKDEEKLQIDVPSIDAPNMFMMPLYDQPSYITDNPNRTAQLVTGVTWHGSKSKMKKFANKFDYHSVAYTTTLKSSFSRLLAKIAYGMTIFYHGLNALDEIFVLPAILGKKDDIGKWVGCWEPHKSPKLLPKTKEFHVIELLRKNDEVLVKIRLLANFQTPEYVVIVGKLKEGL